MNEVILTDAQVFGYVFGAVLSGYLAGCWVSGRLYYKLPKGNICSCHNPIRYAIWKYTGIGALLFLCL